MTEAQLIDAALAGDQDAFTELYKTHIGYVRAVAAGALRTAVAKGLFHIDDVDDACQDVFLKAFTRLRTFEHGSNLRTWLTRITINRCLDALKHRSQITNGENYLIQLMPEGYDEAHGDYLEGMCFSVYDRNLGSIEARLDLPRFMSGLSAREREMLEMAYRDGASYKDIAARFGCSLATVKACIMHAKKKVQSDYPTSGRASSI